MAFEFATFLFSEILRCPWCIGQMTGNIMEDMVMLFLLPTIIIILFVYVVVTDLKIIRSPFMKLLLGLGFYLFIIFGGFFELVASVTKTYFIVLLFILGIFYFVVGHFLKGGDDAVASAFSRGMSGSGSGGSVSGVPNKLMGKLRSDGKNVRKEAQHQLKLLKQQKADYEKAISKLAANDPNRAMMVMNLNQINNDIRNYEYRYSKRQFNDMPWNQQ